MWGGKWRAGKRQGTGRRGVEVGVPCLGGKHLCTLNPPSVCWCMLMPIRVHSYLEDVSAVQANDGFNLLNHSIRLGAWQERIAHKGKGRI